MRPAIKPGLNITNVFAKVRDEIGEALGAILRVRRVNLVPEIPCEHRTAAAPTFGGKGKEAGKLDCPHGIIVDTRGATPILTVADRGNARIRSYVRAS